MAAKLFSIALIMLPFYLLLLLLLGKKQHFWYAFKAFLFGVLSTFPLLVIRETGLFNEHGLQMMLLNVFVIILILAVIEELFKTLAIHCHSKVSKRHVDMPLVRWVAVGLGFAYLENVLYVASAFESSDFIVIAFLRFLFGTAAHGTFTALSGTVALRFSGPIASEIKGILSASFSHTLFNFSNHLHLTFLALPIIIASLIYTLCVYKKYYSLSPHYSKGRKRIRGRPVKVVDD